MLIKFDSVFQFRLLQRRFKTVVYFCLLLYVIKTIFSIHYFVFSSLSSSIFLCLSPLFCCQDSNPGQPFQRTLHPDFILCILIWEQQTKLGQARRKKYIRYFCFILLKLNQDHSSNDQSKTVFMKIIHKRQLHNAAFSESMGRPGIVKHKIPHFL